MAGPHTGLSGSPRSTVSVRETGFAFSCKHLLLVASSRYPSSSSFCGIKKKTSDVESSYVIRDQIKHGTWSSRKPLEIRLASFEVCKEGLFCSLAVKWTTWEFKRPDKQVLFCLFFFFLAGKVSELKAFTLVCLRRQDLLALRSQNSPVYSCPSSRFHFHKIFSRH